MVDGKGSGGEDSIAARRGVILAAGGFAQDTQMIENFAPGMGRAKVVGGQGNFGDGIKMAWALGAGLRDMPYVKGTFGNRPDAGPTEHTALLPIYKGAIVVNRDGRRFADESLDYKLLGDACLEQPGESPVGSRPVAQASVHGPRDPAVQRDRPTGRHGQRAVHPARRLAGSDPARRRRDPAA